MPSENDTRYREIVTKAVCGKGKKNCKDTHFIKPPQKPSSILGCWIINHEYEADRKGDSVEVIGSYDVNVWYSYDDNTKTDVITDNVSYTEVVPLKMKQKELIGDEVDVIARAIKQPNTLEASIGEKGKEVEVEVEKEFSAEIVGETKVCIQIHPDAEDDDYKNVKWEEQVSEEELKKIDTDFLEDKNQ
ncbi:outer spore coat protein CotE [Salibacterium salarium]|uniref:Outer spore coat protein CotE n=1 Tax=Salibacterium salarium TaxID=284579 RepID=A0A3R9QT29_9BACI|nr:outer spore coat protein CotE [Salibacterium salarium]RSL32783.1 outer spore coat protein CotE [Salibacterium salarium]